MVHRRFLVALAAAGFGLLTALPACADDQPQQIIGPAPTMTCCWGNAPDQDQAGPRAFGPAQVSLSPLAVSPLSRGDWINRAGQD